MDIAPADPLLAYFQQASGAVEIDRLDLDSPALRQLKAAGVKLVVPLISQGELIGPLNLGPRLSEQEYSTDDKQLLEKLAAQASPAVRVAQLVREQEAEVRAPKRIEQELRVAQLIQQQFLPKHVPDLPGWQVAAFYRAAQEVGGDFYDFIDLDGGRLGLVVGDVTGHGVPAALVMATTRSFIRRAAPRRADAERDLALDAAEPREALRRRCAGRGEDRRRGPALAVEVRSQHLAERGHPLHADRADPLDPPARPNDRLTRSAAVVGSGPNGLAAAIELARRGTRVTVLEAEDTIGGGCRSAELTLPGFVHDVCSAIHPLAAASPFFSRLPLAEHGVEWIHPAAPLAHPLDDGTAVLVHRSLERAAAALGADGAAWSRTIGQVARDLPKLRAAVTGPALAFPRHPVALARFGLMSLWPARLFARRAYRTERARAVFAGLAAHSFLSLDAPLSTTFALMLGGTAHAVGWPFPRGGSQRVVDALTAILRSHGGEIVTTRRVRSLGDVPSADAILFDVTPRQLERIAGDRFPERYRRALRAYRYGPGVFKLDYALDGPVPWRAPECALAGTVHVGGTLDEIADAEREVARGGHPERPFVLVAQQSLFDRSRAPEGKHTLWAYCHVPNGSTVDMTLRIEAQIERFAPHFRDRILARHVMDTRWVEGHNETYVGGDISAGSHGGLQLFARPVLSVDPYATPDRSIYLCSAATPPGGGVHGMCGYHAARSALRKALKEG